MAGRGMSSSYHEVIDLTQSDDEEPIQTCPSAAAAEGGLNNVHLAQAPSFFSYDGLPSGDSNTKPTRLVDKSNPYVILPQHARSVGDSRAQLASFNGGSIIRYHRSPGQEPSSTAAPTMNRSEPEIMHSEPPTKRRKTNSELHSQRPRPILPPAPQYRQTTQPTQKMQLVRRAESASQAKTVISGASRAGASQAPRISPEGRVQNPRPPMRTYTIAEKCLQNQVIPRVKEFLRQYQNALPAETRSLIGVQVAKQLIGDRAFYDDFKDNKQRLSQQYEENLTKTAQAYVNRYVKEALAGLQSEGVSSKSQNFVDTAQHKRQASSSWMSNSLLLSNESDLNTSDEEAIVKERYSTNVAPAVSYSVSPRNYSSSPTTSFSNDHTEDEKVGRSNVPNANLHNDDHVPRLRRSVRAATSSRLLLKPPPIPAERSKPHNKLKSRTQPPIRPQSKSDALNLRECDISAARQVQSLYLAAQDNRVLRPYLSSLDRKGKIQGFILADKYVGCALSTSEMQVLDLRILHVDFCQEEIKTLCSVIKNALGNPASNVALGPDLYITVATLMAGQEPAISMIQRDLQKAITQSPGGSVDRGILLLRQRDQAAVKTFLQDAAAGRVSSYQRAFHLRPVKNPSHSRTKTRLSSLLLQREVHGSTLHRVRSGQESFRSKFTSSIEDSLIRQSEYTDCSGDVATISWTSETAFICGATAHSDFHNMQYNKPGNLALGSSLLDTLRAVSKHRIVRPIINQAENSENSLSSMRQTQDPWLYTSVVSTAHNKKSGFTFTASFDATVKVWRVAEDGFKMDLCGAWYHNGKVNFVVTSEHHDRVATAADVTHDAVRVYSLDETDISNSSYDPYGGNRAQEQGVELSSRETWAYFPATVQWGKAYNVSHLLLVGYSPRSLTSHEVDIPEDKRNTGELCLWNTLDCSWVNISAAKTRNVFEVIWHPSQPIFLSATSPSGNHDPMKTKTQIRVFAQNELGTFLQIRALDCPAMDINELTIMPNSCIESYVTASCTDGNTYVYDTAQGDQPVHILQHGESLDNPIHDIPREMADSGVKFAAWGQSKTRFYTGASDGKVKVWDVTAPPKEAFIRDLLIVSGGISAGAFSKDFSQLVIGDATGKVHLLKADDSDLEETSSDQMPNSMQSRQMLRRGGLLPSNIRRPKVLIPHPEPAPPVGVTYVSEEEQSGKDIAQHYIEEGIIEVHKNRLVGAIQGANYSETGFYRLEAHEGYDGTQPLLAGWQAKQRKALLEQSSPPQKINAYPRIVPPIVRNSNPILHQKNVDLDFDFSTLSLSTQEELRNERVELDWDTSPSFPYELSPGKQFSGFKEDKESKLERKKREKWNEMLGLAGEKGGY